MANQNKSSEKCLMCNKGILEQKSVSRSLFFKDYEFTVHNVPAEVCSKCKEVYISIAESEKLDKAFLREVWNYFNTKIDSLPGDVALWITKVIGITSRELAAESRVTESTISQTYKRNATLNTLTTIVLLFKTNDYLENSTLGAEMINIIQNPAEAWNKKVQVDNIVCQVIQLEQPTQFNVNRFKRGPSSTLNPYLAAVIPPAKRNVNKNA